MKSTGATYHNHALAELDPQYRIEELEHQVEILRDQVDQLAMHVAARELERLAAR